MAKKRKLHWWLPLFAVFLLAAVYVVPNLGKVQGSTSTSQLLGLQEAGQTACDSVRGNPVYTPNISGGWSGLPATMVPAYQQGVNYWEPQCWKIYQSVSLPPPDTDIKLSVQGHDYAYYYSFPFGNWQDTWGGVQSTNWASAGGVGTSYNNMTGWSTDDDGNDPNDWQIKLDSQPMPGKSITSMQMAIEVLNAPGNNGNGCSYSVIGGPYYSPSTNGTTGGGWAGWYVPNIGSPNCVRVHLITTVTYDPAVLSLTPAAQTVVAGANETLTYSATNVSSCSLSGTNGDSWTGIGASGSRTTRAITSSATYTLSCIGNDGNTKTATATVTPGGPTNVDLPNSVSSPLQGQAATISPITASNVQSCQISGKEVSPYTATFGPTPLTVVPPQSTTVALTSGSGTYTVPAGVTQLQVLVVAGGGGGGNSPDRSGGGGGGGGVVSSSYSVTPGQGISYTVGAGGGPNAAGGDSTFGSLTAVGGGRGGQLNSGAGSGGSGGGGYHNAADSGKAGTAGQGNNGGSGYDSGDGTNGTFDAGGGGGAGAAGGYGGAGAGGAGGAGFTYFVNNTTYGGGGGGGCQHLGSSSCAAGAGGAGGGGAGASGTGSAVANGAAGTPNTGGGGGGGGGDALGWVSCASENYVCSFSGTKNVRYGYNGSYYYGVFTNSVSCSNSVFGDPYVGHAKGCDYSDIGVGGSGGSGIILITYWTPATLSSSSYTTGAINHPTAFTLDCTGYDGTHATDSVTITPILSCTYNGTQVQSGSTEPFYSKSSIPPGGSCTAGPGSSQSFLCTNGTFNNVAPYVNQFCSVRTAADQGTPTLTASQYLTRAGTRVLLTWSGGINSDGSGADRCSLAAQTAGGTSVISASATSGTNVSSGAINQKTTFTLTCAWGTASKSVSKTVNIVPAVQEI